MSRFGRMSSEKGSDAARWGLMTPEGSVKDRLSPKGCYWPRRWKSGGRAKVSAETLCHNMIKWRSSIVILAFSSREKNEILKYGVNRMGIWDETGS